MAKIAMSALRAQFPMYSDVSDEKLAMAVRKQFYSDMTPGQFYGQIDWDTQRLDPTSGMSTLDKVRANVGAGMVDAWEGAKQFGADITGRAGREQRQLATDERRAQNDQLAASLPGGRALQIAGGIAPTLAVPAGGLVRGAQGLRMLPQAMNAAGRGAQVADAALVSGGLSALTPVGTGESRAQNVVMGAGLGAALPATLGVGAGIRERVTRGGRASRAQNRAGDEIAAEVAGAGATAEARRGGLERTLAGVRGAQARRMPDEIPLSVSARLADPQLARLEAGSRARNGANWYDFDQGQAQAVSGAFDRATAEAGELGARQGARRSNWNTNWASAQGAADPQVFMQEMGGFAQRIDDLLRSPESVNPSVRSVLERVKADISDGSRPFTPAHLQQIRANLSGKVRPLSQNPFDTVPRDNPAITRLLGDVDQVLDNTTGGGWSNVRGGYSADSDLVRQSQAAAAARRSYYDPQTGRVLGVAADAAEDIPKITEAGLGRAMNAARGQLSQGANQQLEDILSALRQQGIVQGVKRSATAGGGSNTASDLMAAQAARQASGALGSVAGGPVGAVAGDAAQAALTRWGQLGNDARDEVLARALQDPEEMIRVLERALANGTITPQQNVLLTALRGAGLGANQAMPNQ